MSVSLFTEKEVRGTGLSPRHGNLAGGCMARLNELIALANDNEAAIALTHGSVLVDATPYTVPANVNIVLVDTATIGAGATINLPPATAAMAGRRIVVVDSSGTGATNNVDITPDGTDEIDDVVGAVTIDDNYGGIAIVCEGLGAWVTGPSYGSLAAHEAVRANAHGKVMGTAAAIDMVVPAANPVALNGGAAYQFVPKEIVLVVDAGAAALAGALTITVGTTPGGVEIMGAAVVNGLNAAGLMYRIPLAGLLPEIAGNAALDISVTVGDAGGGAAGTMTGYIIGEEV